MKKSSTLSASQTTTDGYTSSESPAASEILSAAMLSQKSKGWLGRLSQEHRDVVLEVKRRWRESRGVTGVSAAHLARTLILRMPDCGLPTSKEIASWLHRDQ